MWPVACDINPLSRMLLEPRLSRRRSMRFAAAWTRSASAAPCALRTPGVFTTRRRSNEIAALRHYLLDRELHGALDAVDRWIPDGRVNA